MKHTKGPWKVHDTKTILAWNEDTQESEAICFVGSNDTYEEQDTANTHLIAAAPEMLEALEMILDPKFRNETGWTNIRRIIKKARGEL